VGEDEEGMDSFQYSSLKCGLCEAGNFDGAVKIYKEMGGGGVYF
jgi:pentatricopeptide repeat protein